MCSIRFILNPIRPGVVVWGGGGGHKVPALTLNVNNFFNFKANATKLSNFSRMDKFENTLV